MSSKFVIQLDLQNEQRRLCNRAWRQVRRWVAAAPAFTFKNVFRVREKAGRCQATASGKARRRRPQAGAARRKRGNPGCMLPTRVAALSGCAGADDTACTASRRNDAGGIFSKMDSPPKSLAGTAPTPHAPA
jgi:hypothetical protein